MCVSATLEVAGRKSALFEMHKSSLGWQETLAPGQQGKLTVYFDPNFHGREGLGRIWREVRIDSNDPQHPVTIIEFFATVVD
ncbi:MAG: hypothetical protein D6736_11460 [Nitrospinota bacterium]|nr:MAG: hypothetical protein D6736_11460 [Nitrospinota bacterium]